MPLPEGFRWSPRTHLDKAADAIRCGDDVVCYVDQRADGTWSARLEVQKPFEHPLVFRDCTGYEAGRAGCEAWVHRYADRLREEVAAKDANRASRHWACGPGRVKE